MNKTLLFYIMSLVLLTGCTKNKKEGIKETFSGSADMFTDLSKYKIKKKIINDSVFRIEGSNNIYSIKGNIDRKRNEKVDWWKVIDVKDSTNKLKIQYVLVEQKSIVNQIISYKNGEIDSLNSKFYLVKNIDGDLKYSFYIPSRSTRLISSKFYYLLDGKEYIKICDKKFDHYECVIENTNSETILGVFTEAMENNKNKNDIDLTHIYTGEYK